MKLVASLFAGLILLGATTASAQQVLKLTFTDPDDPTTVATAAEMHVLAGALERFTGGQIKAEIYPNGQLGDQKSMIQQVRRGTIGMANIASGVLASLYSPKLGIVDLPFLFESRSHLRKALDVNNPMIKQLLDEVAKDSGIRILSLNPYGFRHMTTKDKEVREPKDLAGLKMRTMEVVPHQEMMKAMGASPVPIPYLELYTSLQTGVVSGQENPPTNIIQQKFYQVQQHMTETSHLMTVGALIANEEWYQKLTPEMRAAVNHAVRESDLAHDGVGAVQAILSTKKLREFGMKIYTPTPDEMKKFRQATEAPVRGWAEQQWGKPFVDGFYKALADAAKY
ncbi:MAG: TRAP transporter substrate-binding protein [Methylobacteriaceae bacterium]|nr:TRAP transporter substrate-binding protein [Methylobacteriaceae bacterium]